jgi:hypothetical protein
MIHDCPMDICMRNLRRKAEQGKKTGFLYQVPTSVLLQENVSCVPQIWGRMYNMVLGEPKV